MPCLSVCISVWVWYIKLCMLWWVCWVCACMHHCMSGVCHSLTVTVSVCVHTCTWRHACVYVCVHVCVHASAFVCMCVCKLNVCACMHCHIMWHMFMNACMIRHTYSISQLYYICEIEYVHLCCISSKVPCKDCTTHFLSTVLTFTDRQATNIPLSPWFTANGDLLLIRKLFLGKSIASVTVESNLWPVLSVVARHRHVGWARDGGASCNTVLLWV